MTLDGLRSLVRTIPDFPKPGILFRDVTTLMGNGPGFATAVSLMVQRAQQANAQIIAGIEARGFIFGAAIAAQMGLPFVPIRKPGKLPVPVMSIDYELEYGTDKLELDPSAITQGARMVVIDDLIATGGTALAAVELIQRAGGHVVQSLFAIDLPVLGGSDRLREKGVPAEALMAFDGH